MAHNHHSSSHQEHRHEHGTGNIALAFFLNLSFCIIELIGGLLTNSIAILSDALHDFGDSVALGLAWIFQKISGRKPTPQYTYGYKRFSLLSAFINSVILITGSIFVFYESIQRILSPSEINAQGMLLLAVLGVIVNGAAIFRLKKGNSVNERVVSLHLLEDVLGWIAVLIVSVIMMFVDLPILDPLLSIGISIYILYNVYRNLKTIFLVILQGKPANINEKEIAEKLKNLPGVEDIHDLHIWTMDSEYNVLTVHLVLNASGAMVEQQKIRLDAHLLLKSLGIQHATIEIECADENCEWCETR
ncbi:MAG: cation diffusion facilitator family transporter [Dysgonamonadaceae bacterium]|jgi:cobalt-zinc-cadmium efflux system protein|nr:cation diffusion facilitator family transporter [Dysgonamonadaceae bacterium]